MYEIAMTMSPTEVHHGHHPSESWSGGRAALRWSVLGIVAAFSYLRSVLSASEGLPYPLFGNI